MVIHSAGRGYERGTKISGRDGNFKLVRDGLPEKITFVLSSDSSKDDPWRCSRPKRRYKDPELKAGLASQKAQAGFGTGDLSLSFLANTLRLV